LFPDGTIQHGGVTLRYAAPYPITPCHYDYRKPAHVSTAAKEMDGVTGACMLVRREVFSALGGFDEGYVNGYEDVDLCMKVRTSGGRILYDPRSVLIHHESVSDGRFDAENANINRLHERWMDAIKLPVTAMRGEPS